MIQCFVKQEFCSIFENGKKPHLLSASKIDSTYTKHPRMLHCHNGQLEILYVRSGNGIYIIEEDRYPITGGDVIVCNSGVLHDEDPAHSHNLNTFSFALTDVHIRGLDENCLVPKNGCPLIPCQEFSDMIENLMESVYTLLAANTEGVEESCTYLAASTLTLIFQMIHKNKAEDKVTNKKANHLSREIKQYIDTHYDEDLTLNSIGEALHMNPYYISHVFKNNIGYSPIQYLLRRRIGEAQNLLIHTDHSITMVASMIGYNNPSHFNSMFAKYINMSPSEYRKNYIHTEKKK